MKKTAQELIKIIEDNNLMKPLFEDDFDDIELEDAEGETIKHIEAYVESLGLGELDYKDRRCDTSEFWQVIYFKDHDIYLKIIGEYDSYMQYEHEYDSIKEVKPKEVTKLIYE